MIDWLARANFEISQKRPEGTDKTAKTILSSVSSLPLAVACEKRSVVSSVSSVGVAPIREKRVSLMTVEQADQCHAGGWDDAEIQAFTDRRDRLLRWGYTEQMADHVAERLTLRDREQDDRRLCAECRHGRSNRCPDGAPMPADVLHRCTGYKP